MDELLRIYPNDNLSINIDNLNNENANEFAQFNIILEKEGEKIWEDTVDLDIEPGRNYWYFFEPAEDLANGEYVYTLTGKATKAINGLKKGAPIAHAQKIFKIEGRQEEPKEVKQYKDLEVKEDGSDIVISGEDFSMTFSKGFGGITDLNYGGVDYLNSKPQITFWRPLTDTDLALGLNFESGFWLGATIGQQLLPEKFYFEKIDNSYRLTFVYRYPLPGGQESAVIYTVHPDGTLGVESTYSGLATIDYLPAFGMNFKLNKDLDAVKYYGYGPEENYIDTTEGLDLNVYETTVRRNFKKNERPTETGNRTGVRWAEVYNSKTGKGLRFTSDTDVFEFAALPFNDLEIEAAATLNELPKVANTNVRIAGKVSGIGNGYQLEDWARIDAGEMIELKFNIKPVTIPVKTSSRVKKEAPAKKDEPKVEAAPVKKEEPKVESTPAKEEKTPVKEETVSKVTPLPKKEAPVKKEETAAKVSPVQKTETPAKKTEETKAEVKVEKKPAPAKAAPKKEQENKTPAKKTSRISRKSKTTK